MFCLNGSSINIFDSKSQTLDNCFVNTYLLSPSYLAFSVINAYYLGSSNDLSRNLKQKNVNYLRLIVACLFTTILIDLFSKYFINLTGSDLNTNSLNLLTSSLISDTYKLISFTLHTLLIFNKSLFTIKYPNGLLISFFVLLIANILNLINYLYENAKFADLSSFQKYNTISLFIYNLFLILYFTGVVLSYFTNSYQSVSISHLTIESEEDSASYYSYLTFKWLKPLMKRGFLRKITKIEHLCNLPNDLNIEKVCTKFMSKYVDKNYNEYLNNPIMEPHLLTEPSFLNKSINYADLELLEPKKELVSKNSLIKCLLRSFGRNFLWLGVLRFLNDCLGFSGPLLLNQLVQFVEVKDSDLKDGVFYALALFFTSLICSLLNIHFTNLLNKFCLRIKTSLISLVYQKAVLVKLNELNKYSTGQIVNYMSIDNDSIVNAFPSFHSFWSLPFQIFITLYLLYSQIGLSFLVGVAFVIILIPINKLLSDYIGKVQKKLMIFKDQRVKVRI